MMKIFLDMVKDRTEVFMDNFNVIGDSFEVFLKHLYDVFKWCEKCYLVLNREKCHFMVKEGILL